MIQRSGPPRSGHHAPASHAPPRRVLIAGGGVAGLETMLALRELAGSRIDVEVLAPETTFHYSPLDVAQPFGRGGVRDLCLAELVHSAGGRHRTDRLVSVDAERRVVATAAGMLIPYDVLVVCTGARAGPAIDGAVTFRGQPDLATFGELLSRIDKQTGSVAFVLPPGASWALPLYELAFLTTEELARRARRGVDLMIATHEQAPLEIFGPDASREVALRLKRDGIGIRTGVNVVSHRDGQLRFASGEEIAVDHVVAMPRLHGPAIPGLPHDADGFLPTDRFGRVLGVRHVYAAGDATNQPIKQGGLASRQADAAASAIAAWAGADVQPAPLRPVLRGYLLTAGAPQHLELDLGSADCRTKLAHFPHGSTPTKIAARYLSPFLTKRGVGQPGAAPPPIQE